MSKKYVLEDLKEGMVVSFSEISGIYDTVVVFDAKSMDYSTGDPKVRIVCLGVNYQKGVNPSELLVYNNCGDMDENMTEVYQYDYN